MESHHNNYLRFFTVILVFFLLYGMIILNLYFIQIQQTSFFKNLGDKQYNITLQTLPQRAYIYDRNNNPVAINKDSIAAFILPKALTKHDELFSFLEKHFPQAVQRFPSYRTKNFMFIKRNLTPEEIELIEKTNHPDIHLLNESSRFYPYESLGTVIGITDIDNNGLFGLESQYNKELAGTPTTYNLKKDAKSHHFYFSKETKEQGTDGKPITLTIDAEIQFKMQNILDEAIAKYESLEGGALAMDPHTGEILAMVSYPHFDPNNTKALDMETTKNRPLTNCFESGSVIKIFMAMAALQEGVTDLDEIIDCEDLKETKLDHLRIRTTKPHGKIPFLQVIQYSNNIGTVKVAKRLGTELYDYYTLLGFGQSTGVNFPGEQKGFVNPPSNWSAYSIQSLSYGYEITVSLLQLARAFSLLINGGYLVTPKLIKDDIVEKTGPLISQKTLDDVYTILEATVQAGSGTRAQIAGYKILGKTGTANILIDGKYDEDRHLYTFMGAIQKDDYQRVIVCYVKDSKRATYASMVTAPLFKELAECMILHEQTKNMSL
ncbi:MAG TPA: penicillin-binding protein 2 [Candidatus Saccharimonadales bacterium]|nr:penicillin-binding protein 2 [Candidatus Saccharimonadales bacterium]